MISFRLQKKGMTELVSFVLLTLLIVLASTSAYYFSKDFIDDNVAELDERKMKLVLKKIYYKTLEISSFENASSSLEIYFNKGELAFKGNSVYYQSLIPLYGDGVCIDFLCQQNVGGFSRHNISLTSPYSFSENITLAPGHYTIFFKNNKNESKISIKFK